MVKYGMILQIPQSIDSFEIYILPPPTINPWVTNCPNITSSNQEDILGISLIPPFSLNINSNNVNIAMTAVTIYTIKLVCR